VIDAPPSITVKPLFVVTALLLNPLAAFPAANVPPKKPNVIVLLADDLGYADLGCQGSTDVVSPNIDTIAANGVRFTSGYVTAPQCCPSRAGLITGRYPNRFGFETNWPVSVNAKAGLPTGERTIADHLKAAGYITGMIGKWHLGDGEGMQPYRRGFDESFWHPNGGVLFPDPKTGLLSKLRRGPDLVKVPEYSTDAFGREAVAFIDRHQNEPFFLYVAFVPPHWPMEAKPEDLAKFAHIPDLHRRAMLAMMASLDENVGRVLAKLREAKLEENTLVFFLSDNGGATGRARSQPDADFEFGNNTSKNDPCRGVKGKLLEGGIRIPFMLQWKGRIPAGKTYDHPVISLDILPTALAAAGSKPVPEDKLDGGNLLPFLTGENATAPHETLYWRFRYPSGKPALHRWAIRQGDWKLVKDGSEPLALYDLGADIGEAKNLAADQPARVAAMQVAYQRWDAQNREPLWKEDPASPPDNVRGNPHASVQVKPTEIRVECTGLHPQITFSNIPAALGPFTLEIKLKSTSKGPARIFWSTDGRPTFSDDQSVSFEPAHDGQEWLVYTVNIPAITPAPTFLRFDPGNAPGLVRIARFVLKDANEKEVKAWMGKPSAVSLNRP
jgi:arylsulfatase A-like enzyme